MHYAVINVLRALLAWIVVAAHVTWYTGLLITYPKFDFINKFAYYAVLEFVIISGFVITNLVLRSNESYGSYLQRRFFRIYPVYLVCLLAGVVTTLLTFHAFDMLWQPQSSQAHDLQMISASLRGRGFFEHLSAHLALLHGMIPDSSLYYSQMMFLAPAWSLSLEWQFYMLAPFVVRVLQTNRGIWPYCLVALALAGQALSMKSFFGAFALPSFLPGAGAYFAIGILTRLQLDNGFAIRKLRPDLVLLVVGALLLKLPLAPLLTWVGVVLAMTGVMAPITDKLRSRPLLRLWETLEELGLQSYSTYLVHLPIIQLTIYFGAMFSLNVWVIVALVLVVGLSATAICSRLLYQYVERPAMQYASRTFNGLPKPAS